MDSPLHERLAGRKPQQLLLLSRHRCNISICFLVGNSLPNVLQGVGMYHLSFSTCFRKWSNSVITSKIICVERCYKGTCFVSCLVYWAYHNDILRLVSTEAIYCVKLWLLVLHVLATSRSDLDGYKLVVVAMHGDFIVLSH